MTQYSGNLRSLNDAPSNTSAPSGESDLARRAREIVDRDRGTVGRGPNAETMQAIENERRLQRMSGEFSKSSHNLPTVRGDEATGDAVADQLKAAIEENQRKLRETLTNYGYSAADIQTALDQVGHVKREDQDDALRPNESVSQREYRLMNERILDASHNRR